MVNSPQSRLSELERLTNEIAPAGRFGAASLFCDAIIALLLCGVVVLAFGGGGVIVGSVATCLVFITWVQHQISKTNRRIRCLLAIEIERQRDLIDTPGIAGNEITADQAASVLGVELPLRSQRDANADQSGEAEHKTAIGSAP